MLWRYYGSARLETLLSIEYIVCAMSAVAGQVVEAAANAMKTRLWRVPAVRPGRVGCGEKSSCCREKCGVKSVDLCVEQSHAMIYDSRQYARGRIRGIIGCFDGVRFYAGAH